MKSETCPGDKKEIIYKKVKDICKEEPGIFKMLAYLTMKKFRVVIFT